MSRLKKKFLLLLAGLVPRYSRGGPWGPERLGSITARSRGLSISPQLSVTHCYKRTALGSCLLGP